MHFDKTVGSQKIKKRSVCSIFNEPGFFCAGGVEKSKQTLEQTCADRGALGRSGDDKQSKPSAVSRMRLHAPIAQDRVVPNRNKMIAALRSTRSSV